MRSPGAPERRVSIEPERFRQLRVLVVGDAMLDTYLHGEVSRLCREGPVPVVALQHRLDAPGGAANTAANLRALGATVTLLSVVGRDREGGALRRALHERGVDTSALLRAPQRRTLTKVRVLVEGQLLVRLDNGSTEQIDAEHERAVIGRLAALAPHHDALVISDYGYGVLTPAVITQLSELQRRAPRVLVLDAKQPEAYRGAGITAVKPNYEEALRLIGQPPVTSPRARLQQIVTHSDHLLSITGAHIVAVTLDRDGALCLERGRPPYRTYARAAPRAHAVGAGDTWLSAFTLALAAGADTAGAAELAAAAAAVAVGKGGSATCSADELRAWLQLGDKYLGDRHQLAARVAALRAQGKRIVFTNGCFDILHHGHVLCLNRAKALGDVLIVGLNSDASVRRLKGEGRPINPLADRAQVLAALSAVDYVVPFDEDTPAELIRAIRPDLYVKGGDYTRATLPEAQLVESLGGAVQILPYLSDHSTTAIVARIRAGDRGARAMVPQEVERP
jgi:D-beta-D-heptose 7-phosphate kinase/D-beta-D-heptose 1-phosphate adenosyltransferase